MDWKKRIRSHITNILPKRLQDARRVLTGYNYTISYNPPLIYTYNYAGCTTIHNPECVQSRLFLDSFEKGMEGFSDSERWEPTWNTYISCWAAQQALNLEGDFVECGVWKGCISRTILHYTNNLNNTNKKFWLFDTFDGFVDTYLSEAEKRRESKLQHYGEVEHNNYLNTYDIVQHKFKDFPNVKIVKGPVPDSLENFSGDKVCYLSIDMNCAYAEIGAINFFWDKLVAGAIVVLDDYNWLDYIDQKRAFDTFAKEHGFEVLALPTGQGLIIKT